MLETIFLTVLVTLVYAIVFLIGGLVTNLPNQFLQIKTTRFWTIVGGATVFGCLSSAIATVAVYQEEELVEALFLPIMPLFVSGYSMMRRGTEADEPRSVLRIRMDTEVKRKATTVLVAMGLTPSEAVRLLFHRIAADQTFPLELKVPNAQTRAAMAEVDEMVKTHNARFASPDELFAELEDPAAIKRANLPRLVDYARPFLKDWERLSHSGRYDKDRLKEIMLLLIANEALGPERRDHALRGSWARYRQCHVSGDFLLIYRLDDTDGPSGSIYFARVETHAELFG